MSTSTIDRHVAIVLGDGTIVDGTHPLPTTGSGGGGGGAVTVADGADTAEGLTTDAAVQGDNPGTVSAKLRGLNKSVAAGVPVTLLTALDNTNDSIDVPLHSVRFVGNIGVTTGSPYANGQLLGSVQVFTGVIRSAGLGGLLDTVTIYDNAMQNAALDVLFFDTFTTATTYTDKTALAINAADLTALAGHVSVLGSHYTSFSANSIATVRNIGLRLKPTPGTIVYVALVCRGTPTFVNSTDLSVAVALRVD